MTLSLEQLGLFSEASTPLRAWPSAVLYADSGCGKSSQFAEAFQDGYFVKTSRTVTRPYYSFLRFKAAEAYVRAWCDFAIHNAAHSNHPQYLEMCDQAGLDAAGRVLGYRSKLQEVTLPTNVHNWTFLNQLTTTLTQGQKSGHRLPVCGVVFDEFSEILRRVFAEMTASGLFKTKKGKDNDWAVQDAAEEWLIALCSSYRDHGLLLGMVCQEAKPVFHEGTMNVKFKGGPETPFGRLRETICRAPDICLRITLETGANLTGIAPAPMVAPAPAPGPLALPANVGGPAPSPSPAPSPAPAPQVQVLTPILTVSPGVVTPTMQEFLSLFSRLPPGVRPPIYEEGVSPDRWSVRKFWTEAHPHWNSKFRDFSASYREPLGFRRLLERAAYI